MDMNFRVEVARSGTRIFQNFRRNLPLLLIALLILCMPLLAQAPHTGGEANLVLPDLGQATFLGGINGRSLLMGGLGVCALGLLFGLIMYKQLENLPVHASMLEISELIYETCKTYLLTQGRFLLILELFIGVIIVLYFGVLQHFEPIKVVIILLFSLVGIGGSFGVACSASASIHSRTPAPRLPASAANRIPATRFRLNPA